MQIVVSTRHGEISDHQAPGAGAVPSGEGDRA